MSNPFENKRYTKVCQQILPKNVIKKDQKNSVKNTVKNGCYSFLYDVFPIVSNVFRRFVYEISDYTLDFWFVNSIDTIQVGSNKYYF